MMFKNLTDNAKNLAANAKIEDMSRLFKNHMAGKQDVKHALSGVMDISKEVPTSALIIFPYFLNLMGNLTLLSSFVVIYFFILVPSFVNRKYYNSFSIHITYCSIYLHADPLNCVFSSTSPQWSGTSPRNSAQSWTPHSTPSSCTSTPAATASRRPSSNGVQSCSPYDTPFRCTRKPQIHSSRRLLLVN